MSIRTIAATLFGLALSGVCTPIEAQTITQEEFLTQLRQNHPLLQKERLNGDLGREEQNALLGAEDWMIFSRAGFSHEQPALSFAGPDRTNMLTVTAGAERTFWSTGGRLSASVASSTASILPRFGFTMPLYQNMVSVSYVHPLLRNSGGTLDRLQYDMKNFDIRVSEIMANENIEQFLTQSATLFLTWVFLSEQQTIVGERLRLSETERDRMLEKRRANLVDLADVLRAEDAVRSWKQQQVQVRSQWKALQAQLAVLSGNKDLYALSPSFDLYHLGELPPLEGVITRLLARSRMLRALDERKQQLILGRNGFEEAMRPDVSVYARVNTKRIDEAFGSSLVMDRPDLNVGVQLSIPLENRTAQAQVARSGIQIEQVQKQIDETSVTLASMLTNVHIRLSELRNVLAMNREQIESARARTAEEVNLYNQGRGELTFVILSRDNEQNVRLTYAQNAWTYHVLMLEYRSLVDEVYDTEVD